jgi:hypothetical protein
MPQMQRCLQDTSPGHDGGQAHPNPLALLDEIIEGYDFLAVQKAMAGFDLAYAGAAPPPAVEALRTMARRLHENAPTE